MVTKDIPINKDILLWARNEANLSTPRAALKAKIRELKARGDKERVPSEVRLERWEKGLEIPTLNQLEQLAKAYRRPILTFFLSEPPVKQTRLEDFRTVGSKSIDSDAFSPELSALLRQLEALQLSLHDLLIETDTKTLQFIRSISVKSNPIEVAERIRALLGYSFDNQKNTGSLEQVFSDIRTRSENLGTFILLEGNLGSHHTNIEPEIFRGLAISDDVAPFIVVNPNDAKSAMIFTLIHELCHILLGETGISNWNSLDISKKFLPFSNEIFCDQVAAEFLVPERELLTNWKKYSELYSTEDEIRYLSRKFNVSKIVIARRLLNFDKIKKDFYWDFFHRCQEEWREQKIRTRNKKELKIPLKIRTRNRLGNKLVNTVMNATSEGRISELDASRVLNVKLNDLTKMM